MCYERAKRSHTTFKVLKGASFGHYCSFLLLSRCFSSKICDKKQKQWINVKLFIKLKITWTECYQLLKKAHGENSLSCVHVFKWYKQFFEGRESTEDDQRPGQPVSTPQTVIKINEIVSDHCMNIRMNAKTVNANKETVRRILHNELNMNSLCEVSPKNFEP